jgi:hypothetical protein
MATKQLVAARMWNCCITRGIHLQEVSIWAVIKIQICRLGIADPNKMVSSSYAKHDQICDPFCSCSRAAATCGATVGALQPVTSHIGYS